MKTNPMHLIATAATTVVLATASPIAKRASDTTTVHLNQCSGSPAHFAQGVLYGVNGTSPPQSYITDLGINYLSEGGAQIDSQPSGYAASMASYQRRFNQLLGAYQRMRAVGGVTIAKMADLYGADETTNNSFVWPGDNGDWTKWDAFVQQLISDIRANGMTAAYVLQLEPWNEPDINFGGRDQSQFNELWRRTTVALRNAFGPNSGNYLPIVGPSTAGNPGYNNGWWNSWLSSIQSNGGTAIQPDVYNWHMEGGLPNDPIPPAQALPAYVKNYGLTTGIGVQNNEFGVPAQQNPGWGAWFHARYERLKFNALRGNWASGAALLDCLAGLLIKNSDGSYSTTGEYQMYKYYKNMNGAPCSTDSGSSIDSYAVGSTNNVTALVGSQGYTGTWNVNFQNINSYFGSATSVKADLIFLPYNSGHAVSGWQTNYTSQTVPVSNNAATVSFNVGNGNDAYAIRLHT
ncbi:glycoside hydrolase [Pseudozyma hubeiensis SY62]|uniref:Glycoside hydrolase n=1 Tax=Pseudozyma hubeiensis (strain SY62) TaxID=1305764 RepID=R9PEN4_PSEHS|nr:glycoside hydrolase [Pseudozyma hubeiensis SY62]GAC96570.1 glycoside hydrolase [Pseudozyma hubeiensis SY62]